MGLLQAVGRDLTCSLVLAAALGAPAFPQADGGAADVNVDDADTTTATGSDAAGLRLTLDEAVAVVLDRNLELQVEGVATAVARFNAYGSWGSFDPVASATLSYSDSSRESSTVSIQNNQPFVFEVEQRSFQQGLNFPLLSGGNFDVQFRADNTESTSPDATDSIATDSTLTLTLAQPLLRGAWYRYATTEQYLAEIEAEKQAQRQRQVRQDLILRVHEAYWDLVEALEQVSVRELSLELGREQLEQDRRRLEVGVGTEVDVLQAETNVASNEEQHLLALANAEAAEDALKSLLFRRDQNEWQRYLDAWDTPIEPLTTLPEVVHTTRQWTRSLGHALQLRSELAQQDLEVRAQERRLLRAESDVLPNADLTLSASGRGRDGDSTESINEAFSTDFPTYTASLELGIPIFNRRAAYAKRVARANLRSALLTRDRTEQDIVSDVRAKVRDVNYQARAVQAAQKSRELAERQLQAEQARYEEGLSTTFQVLEFQKTLAEARSTEKAARATYARNLAQLRRSEGWLGEEGGP